MVRWQRVHAIQLVVGIATLVLLSITGTTAIASAVTQDITGGTRTVNIADLTLPTLTYAHSAQTSTGSMILTADDSTGSNAGWNVTIQTTAFEWSIGASGAVSGTDIPAVNFSLTSAAAPVMTAGQAVDPSGGPRVPTVSPVGALDTARKTVQADLTFGNGTYNQTLGVSLAIPAHSAAGRYTGTLTLSIVSGP